MKGIGYGVPLLIPVSAIPEAENRKDGPLSQQETEAKLRKVDFYGSKADELRTGILES